MVRPSPSRRPVLQPRQTIPEEQDNRLKPKFMTWQMRLEATNETV
jgi:hypothetical protein